MKLKNIILGVACLPIIFACQSTLQNTTAQKRAISSIENMNYTLPQTTIPLQGGGTEKILADIRGNWKSGTVREVKISKDKSTYEVYVGEVLKFSATNIKNVDVSNPTNMEIEFKKEGSNYYFRSLYQAIFVAKIEYVDGRTQKIKIANKMKYKFSKDDSYSVTKALYDNGSYDEALKNIDLYFLSFPFSPNNKAFYMLCLKVYIATNNFNDAKDEIVKLRAMKNLTQEDIALISGYQAIINSQGASDSKIEDIAIPSQNKVAGQVAPTTLVQITTETPAIPNAVTDVASGTSTTLNAVANVTDVIVPATSEGMAQVDTTNDENYLKKGIELYNKNKYAEALKELMKITDQQTGIKASYYMGQSYFELKQYDKALDAYSLYLTVPTTSITQAESYYKVAYCLEQKNQDAEAIEKLNKITKLFPGTLWARKSNVYIIQIKNK